MRGIFASDRRHVWWPTSLLDQCLVVLRPSWWSQGDQRGQAKTRYQSEISTARRLSWPFARLVRAAIFLARPLARCSGREPAPSSADPKEAGLRLKGCPAGPEKGSEHPNQR